LRYPLSNDEEEKIFERMLKNMGINAAHSIQININNGGTITDIDVLGVFKNALFIVECCGKEKIGKKIRLASKDFELIEKNLERLSEFLKSQAKKFYKETENIWQRIEKGQNVVIKKIFFTSSRLPKDEKESIKKNYENIYLMDFDDFSYFEHLSKLTFSHARYEFFTFLQISPEDIEDKITILSPKVTGKIVEKSKDRDIIVFTHSPDFLLRTTHVSRLYSWDPFGFQRLLLSSKIRKLVNFLKEKKESFPNNIIVATHEKRVDYKPDDKKETFTMTFKDFSYDIFVLIDGQHRLYAFAFNDPEIEKLRKEIQLIVTAIVFKEINEEEAANRMAELFYTINTTYTRIDPKTSIDLQERLWPNQAVSKANMIMKQLNNDEGTFLYKKIEFLPYDKEYFDKKLLPRTTLIRYSGLKEFFAKESRTYSIFNELYTNLRKEFKDYEEFLFWVLKNFLKAVEIALKEAKGEEVAEQLLNDTELKKYYFLTVTVMGALLRLLRHFLSHENPNEHVQKLLEIIRDNTISLKEKEEKMKSSIKEMLKYIFSNVGFTVEEWKNKGWKSSQWALVEREMIDILRKKYSDFGDERLLKKITR